MLRKRKIILFNGIFNVRILTGATSDKVILLFDGDCNLCNNTVKFVLKRDKKEKFIFSALQSPFGKQLMTKFNHPDDFLDSFVLVKKEKIYFRSDAFLQLCYVLGGFWKLMIVFFIVPRPVRDFVYNFIGRNRYKWFGKSDQCMVMIPEWKHRFIA